MTLASPPRPTPVTSPTDPALTKLTLDVQGMKCAGCVSAVERQLRQQPGVSSASVNLVTAVAVVEYQADQVEPKTLAAKLTQSGFPSEIRPAQTSIAQRQSDRSAQWQQTQQRQRWQLILAGILILFSSLGHWQHIGGPTIPGLSHVGFHWGLATLALGLTWRDILADGWRGLRQGHANMNSLVGLGAVSAYSASCLALLFPGLGWECFFDEPVMLLGFILFGRSLESRARHRAAASLEHLLALQPQSVHLMGQQCLSDTGSGTDSEDNDSANRSSIDIKDQEKKNPATITPQLSPDTIEIPVEQVRIGEWVQVLPGEKIPVDGIVVAGQTTVNESMLTGESIPVTKQPGTVVTAGTLNETGAIAVRTEHTAEDTALAQIIATVEAAQARKAPIQQLADRVAGFFAYGVMTVAALTFLFWYGFGTHWWPEVLTHTAHHLHPIHAQGSVNTSALLLSLKLAIAVLVVACPCALGLATPTAILVGTSVGAERGLLIKGGDILERVHQLDTICFDKTGTLTQGKPQLSDCMPLSTHVTSEQLLQLAASAEKGTHHPLGTAIVAAAQSRNISLLSGQDFHTEAGLGIRAIIDHHQVILGNGAWLTQQAITFPAEAQKQATTWAQAGKTPVFVACDGDCIGLLALQDPLRPDAQATIHKLQTMGLTVMLLSGDRQEVVQAIAQSLGISSAWAEITPTQKASLIQQLQSSASDLPPAITQDSATDLATDSATVLKSGPREEMGDRCVAMVGDGMNDAPALAQADIGIALQGSTAVALETAELVLMHSQIQDVVTTLQLSLATIRKIRQNLIWAFSYNVIALPLAAGVLLPWYGVMLSPGIAGALMATSSLVVVLNSLLLRRHASRLGIMNEVDHG